LLSDRPKKQLLLLLLQLQGQGCLAVISFGTA